VVGRSLAVTALILLGTTVPCAAQAPPTLRTLKMRLQGALCICKEATAGLDRVGFIRLVTLEGGTKELEARCFVPVYKTDGKSVEFERRCLEFVAFTPVAK
jgi:hypothetical protein